MTTGKQGDQELAKKLRDPDISGALAALRRAAASSRRRAMETIGAVAVLRDGQVVWEKADGTFTDDPEGARN